MPLIDVRHPNLPRASEITPKGVYLSRRELVAGLASAGLVGCAARPAQARRGYELPAVSRDPRYDGVVDRGVTPSSVSGRYNNYYEFTTAKDEVWEQSRQFEVRPWSVRVEGMCHKPTTFAMEELLKRFELQERVMRFRCVEAWSMVVPWVGFPLAQLLAAVEPLGSARFVRFESFYEPLQATGQLTQPWYPWPYFEALRLDEAMNDLTMMVVGAYGEILPRQHGAPLRLLTPWKYGFKSAKGIVRIELLEERPDTFWHKMVPEEYGFFGNVDPRVPHPRWSQAMERDIETGDERPSLVYNGYGEWVADMYAGTPRRERRKNRRQNRRGGRESTD